MTVSKITCTSPIDGSVYVEKDVQSKQEIENLLKAARTAQIKWVATGLNDRISLVKAAVSKLEDMNDEIVTELAHQMGRPVRYGGEIGGVKERTEHMCSIAEENLAPTIIESSDQFERYIAKEALGLVFVIAPWNYPYLTAINTIVPALVAGNAVVLKHASQTILAGDRFAKAFEDAGLPKGIFTNIVSSHELTSELLKSRSFDFVNFTGSVGGGRNIEQAAAGTFVGVGLELGGKDPAYVRADADLDAAVETLIDGAMFNSGQCCCGIERIYVDESLFDDFIEKAKNIVEGYVLGNPLESETTLGPMANVRFANEIREQIKDALAAGAKSVIDRTIFTRDTGSDAYLAPEILINVDHSLNVMTEESFGPVVGIMKVSSDDQAIELMNDSIYGLTASIWTKNTAVAAELGSQIKTGTVFMNRCDYLDPALCWTGCKETGRGMTLSHLGYQSVTRPKSYHFKKA
ncbi:MAG: aldehyde dehydrogenase family protein [Kordiimonadaceae bacterium]|nr:aldehyde dehydrogenase family protein [Kordiimonadaceae bacterium]